MYKLPPIPTPPVTCNAPVVVLVEGTTLEMVAVDPIYNVLPIPTPPATCSTPVLVLVAAVVPKILT